ncbi:hypothetical protein [Streptomyces olivaceus]|uniref:hypothetical protein n=1 Tax=Streptomyces olivaceus TaxID=47716 RepID=UPI004055CA09
MTAGRKLLPMDRPHLPLQKFAWLVRAIRAFHADAALRNTVSFTEVLNTYLTEPLKPATVNRLESGEGEFSIERCQAYEKALGTEPLDLVDCYLYASRLENKTPRTALAKLREASGEEMELLWRLAQGEHLGVEQWLRLAYLYRNRTDLFTSSRMRDGFLNRLLDDAGNCYEKEERLVREVLIIAGADVVPVLNEKIRSDPLRYFNMCEAVGFMSGMRSLEFLMRLFAAGQDGAVAASILEAVRRNLRNQGMTSESLEPYAGIFKEYAVVTLARTEEFFTAREESLAFLRWARMELAVRERKRLSHIHEELLQLRLRVGERRRKEILKEIALQFSSNIERSPLLQAGMPSRVPGIQLFIEDALFEEDRVGRLAAAVLMRPWQLSAALGTSVGAALTTMVDSKEFGVQRAGVRFLTKLMHPECLDPVRTLGWSSVQDDSVRLTVGWALGTGSAEQDFDLLTHLNRNATTTATRRVLALAAARLGARPILEDIASSRDAAAAAEARQFLAHP